MVKTTEAEKIVMPMAVIINGNTASSAELFALALREKAEAHIVGVQSKGNGVLEYTHKLSGGAAVRVSVAELRTEKSGEFNGVGVKPDFEIAIPNGEGLVIEHNEFSEQDIQLAKAIEVVSPADAAVAETTAEESEE